MDRAAAKTNPRLELVRRYPVAPEKVWRAWTDPQTLSRWFGPGEMNSVSLAQIDLRVGGRYHIRFSTQDGESHDVCGEYTVVEPPRRLEFSWAWKSTPERVSRVSLEMLPIDGGTELRFLHDRFFDLAARDNHQRGWGSTFDKLATLFAASVG
jgi:uncharacterized protein YndB with AHSA1/START domain